MILAIILAMNNFFFEQITPNEIDMALASRVRAVRKRRKMSQKELSERSGVSLGSVKRFESTGLISLTSLTKIAIVLEIEQGLRELFTEVPYKSIEELLNDKNR